MPTFTIPDPKLIEEIEKTGGLAPSTEKKRKCNVGVFSRFLVSFYQMTLEELMESNPEKLEDCLMSFFQSMEVKPGIKPKRETAEGYRSHLKMHILKITGGKVDIRNVVTFSRFDVSFERLF